jgi:hypothetical protein
MAHAVETHGVTRTEREPDGLGLAAVPAPVASPPRGSPPGGPSQRAALTGCRLVQRAAGRPRPAGTSPNLPHALFRWTGGGIRRLWKPSEAARPAIAVPKPSSHFMMRCLPDLPVGP